MVVGFDLVNSGNKSIIALTASYTKHMTQYYSKVVV